MIPLLLLISLFLFLYCVFVLAKDDFLLLRKNVTLEQLFNVSFLSFFGGLFLSRLVFVLEHAKAAYLNPLVFFLFSYFPGLSITGGIFGATLVLWVYTGRKKIPFGRILDIFSVSFFFSWSAGLFLNFIISLALTHHIGFPLLFSSIAFFCLFLLFIWLFATGKLKDGNIGFIGFAMFAIVQFASSMLARGPKNYVSFTIEDVLLIFLFLGFIGMYIQQETLGGFYKHMKKR